MSVNPEYKCCRCGDATPFALTRLEPHPRWHYYACRDCMALFARYAEVRDQRDGYLFMTYPSFYRRGEEPRPAESLPAGRLL